MAKKILLYIFLSLTFLGFSQEQIIKGRIVAPADLKGVNVENLNRKISVLTDKEGNFSIIATTGEVLVFSGININKKVVFVKEEHFENLVEIRLTTTAVEIEEVEIGKQIDMGFGGKKLTPAERRYQTSGQILKLNQGIEINLEAVGNLFNGKRKQLKKELEIEKYNSLLYELDVYFDEDFYVNSLGLDAAYIQDFKYFLIEDENFRKILKSENESEIILKTVRMYELYLKK